MSIFEFDMTIRNGTVVKADVTQKLDIGVRDGLLQTLALSYSLRRTASG